MSTFWKTPEKAVPSLLDLLSKTKVHAHKLVSSDHGDGTHDSLASEFECIESKLKHMKKSLVHIENRETMVVEQLGVLDQVLNDEIFSLEHLSQVGDKVKQIKEDVEKLNSLVSMVSDSVSGLLAREKPRSETNDQIIVKETADIIEEEDESKAKFFLSQCFHCLEGTRIKMCLVLLSVFPENKAILKRSLIYWWIGEGIINKRSDATAEEVGEQIFQELLNQSIIKRITRNSFMVYTSIRQELIRLAKNNSFLEFSPKETPINCSNRAFLLQENKDIDGKKVEDLVTVYNMNEKYLGSSLDMLSRPQKLEVLQMGRWQDSATHHIEAEDHEKLLEKLGSHKQLKYVSLRGISRIETLPRSIRKLRRLLILDLRACHNLNKLPEEVAELRSLTHLDVSECYLLDSMPKGLERLYDLQVLKGFVVSNYCKINDLSGLSRLRKLSIRVGSLGKEQLKSLGGAGFKTLLILTVLWSEASPDGDTVESLPKTLKKLDLRSVPFDVVPQWIQLNKLPDLEKLYIKGGKLKSLNNLNSHDQKVNVKFIRLNYLKNLKINQEDLVALFPNYRYLQRTNCHEHDPNLVLTRRIDQENLLD